MLTGRIMLCSNNVAGDESVIMPGQTSHLHHTVTLSYTLNTANDIINQTLSLCQLSKQSHSQDILYIRFICT